MTDNQSRTGSTNGTVLYINGTNKQINKLISIHTTQSTFKQFMKTSSTQHNCSIDLMKTFEYAYTHPPIKQKAKKI